MVQPLLDLCYREWRKTEARTTALNSWYYLVHVVAYDTKTDVFCVLFDDTAKCSLRRRGHHVCFIEYDEFEAFGEERPGLRELLDLLTDNIDTSVVRGV